MKAKGNDYNHKLPKLELLKKLYFVDKLSAQAIADIYGVTAGAVFQQFRRNNIKRRTLAEAQNLAANHICLSQKMILFIDGLLLGDGSIVPTQKNKSACYAHSDKNRIYLEWLTQALKAFGIHHTGIKSHTNNTFRFSTLHYREFISIRKRWYPNGKKKIPLDLMLTPTVLFNWYIGDGSYYKNNGSQERVRICSEFDQAGKKLMSAQLDEIGIANSIYTSAIYIKKASREQFFRYIISSEVPIISCYAYKFPEEIETWV